MDTFLESYDFSGKTILPFATSGGSGIDGAARNMQARCPGARWVQGRTVHGNAAAWAKGALDKA